MKIQKLPAEARSKLQSGLTVTDAVHCVIELVQNSIDAEATGVAVLIDLKNYQIKVIDNGKGIGKDDLEYVGERFMTSKYQSFIDMDISFPTYGCSGQALSSLHDVSRSLTIETKSEERGPTFVKVFQNNKALPIRKIESERNGTGTAVTVEGFMYKMPVRRKRISEVFDLEEIKNHLQYLAIIHHNVSFTLKNENKGVILLQTPQASNILESIKNIYGKNVAKSLIPLYYEDKKYEVTGFLSIKSELQNSLQLIYINRRIIAKGVIHKFINNLMKEYSRKRSMFIDSPTSQAIKNLKISSHHNAFIILIRCPRLLCELFTNIRKTTVEFKNWTDVLKCVHKAVKGALKNALNLDCSSSQLDESTSDGDREAKRAFGTSLLINAVKGAPVKREFEDKRDIKKRKKLKLNDSKKKSKTFFKNDDSKESSKELINMENHKKETNDSCESPIPKKNLKLVKRNCNCTSKNISEVNQSFVEFYDWLKTKLESDTNAFRLYSDFLQFKSRTNHPSKISEFKSPVLGGKLKRKENAGLRKKNLEKTTKKVLASFSVLDEEMETVRKNQSKILPNSHLRIKRGGRSSAEMRPGLSETLNLSSVKNEIINFKKRSSQLVFNKPEVSPVLKTNQTQVLHNPITPSLASSEIQFSNTIKFRNLTESFFHQTPDTHSVPLVERLGPLASDSWKSAYENFEKNNPKVFEKEKYISALGAPEILQRNNDLENVCNFSEASLDFFTYTNKTKEAVTHRDVEVQVEILKVPPMQKVNATTQTFHSSPESPGSEGGYAFGKKSNSAIKGVTNEREQQGIQFLEKKLNQEVPNPDFWNTSEYMELERANDAEFASDVEIISKVTTTEKNSISVEYICGQKSHSFSKEESDGSASKETQTIAAMWKDSLMEMDYASKNGSTFVTPNLKEQKSEGTQFSKTVPNKEVECEISRHTESGFCLTERHDFVPKGLSPKFINPEPTKLSTLSPREKCKVQLTIDNVQNEALANVKWQDESTGVCLKPKIPDGIFFEMSRKAGESVTNFGDSVLSATLSYCSVKVHHLLHSFTFTKEILSGVEILGQLDEKFIAATVKITTPKKMELISLFDQHAVDERIKLEELINENISPDGKFISSSLNPPVECKFLESDVRVIFEFTEKILNFGISIELVNENTVLVTHAPSLLLNKHEKDLKSKKETSLSDILKSLIGNILEEVTETRGAGSKIPKVLHNILCSEACHKAVKFNKALSVEKMTEMINKLQNCSLPFQCAHGRPSVIPIIDLEDFKPGMEEKENVDLGKLKSFFYSRKEYNPKLRKCLVKETQKQGRKFISVFPGTRMF